MFDVTVMLAVWNIQREQCIDDAALGQSSITVLKRDLILHFPPFLGLEISDKDWSPMKAIRSVRWDVSENRFYCKVEEEFEHWSEHGEYYYDQAIIVDYAVSAGWILMKS